MSEQPAQAPAKPTKAPQKNARRRSREIALQGLYEWLLNATDGGVIEAHLHEAEGFGKADRTHLTTLLHGVIRDAGELTARFTPFLDRPVTELSPVERAAILVGAFELRNCLDIPYRVVINEAVELTKTFGGTDGYKYVNGVLDKLAAELRSAEVESNRRR